MTEPADSPPKPCPTAGIPAPQMKHWIRSLSGSKAIIKHDENASTNTNRKNRPEYPDKEAERLQLKGQLVRTRNSIGYRWSAICWLASQCVLGILYRDLQGRKGLLDLSR